MRVKNLKINFSLSHTESFLAFIACAGYAHINFLFFLLLLVVQLERSSGKIHNFLWSHFNLEENEERKKSWGNFLKHFLLSNYWKIIKQVALSFHFWNREKKISVSMEKLASAKKKPIGTSYQYCRIFSTMTAFYWRDLRWICVEGAREQQVKNFSVYFLALFFFLFFGEE